MRVACLFSGGKDSVYAYYWALSQGWEPIVLVSVFSENKDSYMYHTPNIELTKLQAKSLGVKHEVVFSKGEKESELEDLKQALARLKKELGVEGVVSGALSSEYQKNRVEYVCQDLGLKSFAPLWHKRPLELLREESELFDVLMIGCYAHGFSKDWLGRLIDAQCIKELLELEERFGVSVVGEGGEFETLVVDGPVFRKRLKVKEFETVWDGVRGEFLVKKAVLE